MSDELKELQEHHLWLLQVANELNNSIRQAKANKDNRMLQTLKRLQNANKNELQESREKIAAAKQRDK